MSHDNALVNHEEPGPRPLTLDGGRSDVGAGLDVVDPCGERHS